MKYIDSIQQANKKMALAAQQLDEWRLPANPINYTISYEYVEGKNASLINAVQQRLAEGKTLDNFSMEEFYKHYILGQSKFRDELVDDMTDVVSQVDKSAQQSAQQVERFINKLDANLVHINQGEGEKSQLAIHNIRRASDDFKSQQQSLIERLLASQQKARALKAELDKVKQEIYLDPITGMYNRKALHKHLDTWHKQDPSRQLAAIVVSIDQFTEFHDKFGPLIGNVLLSKIAQKVSSYVDDSGLPVRTTNDEFLIFLPDIDKHIAGEIAEKIRQGVEKLRFISSKSGVRFPKMTISLGVDCFAVSESSTALITKARRILSQHPGDTSNKVILA
ncbi:GGDEF domain-containing protein [Thalassotalea sp. LPB0316]|uniref:GGDEF domain-containing protein n=1 Tax=Thalassotalea sp. LPB0316 TaxID=2769490 RepID=UPI001865C14F|nr:GGDEF domain-containing protein [Thalassotalea sp. LPB0316]QOL26287.1 GGDEF domain-containing protein [Thalassotalea sp. LPB0316]